MENFKHFSDLEIQILRTELGRLMGTEDFQNRVITGFNYYYCSINPERLVIVVSFLHRAKELRDKFEEDLRTNKTTSALLLEERTIEVPFSRKKNAVYLARPNFIVQKNPETSELDKDIVYFDFTSGEDIPVEILERSTYIRDVVKQNPKYEHIGIKEIDGFEINLNIKSREEANEVLQLLHKKAYKFKIDENGFPIYSPEGEEIPNLDAYPLADAVPCIILGKDFERFVGKPLPDFTRCQKISIIKNDDEVSTLIHKTIAKLKDHPAFHVLKIRFGQQLQEIPVYANNYLVVRYIDES